MSQDTNVSNLIINKLTKQQFEGITTPDPTQLYFITDDNGISSLDDISISSLSNGQILKYNSTSGKWENANIPNELPSQSGQSGKYLTTNGSSVSWASISIPTVDQTYDPTSTNAQSGVAVAGALTDMQTKSNLVTSVSSSSTNSQYPSAKLFYDTCGNIESLINAL